MKKRFGVLSVAVLAAIFFLPGCAKGSIVKDYKEIYPLIIQLANEFHGGDAEIAIDAQPYSGEHEDAELESIKFSNSKDQRGFNSVKKAALSPSEYRGVLDGLGIKVKDGSPYSLSSLYLNAKGDYAVAFESDQLVTDRHHERIVLFAKVDGKWEVSSAFFTSLD